MREWLRRFRRRISDQEFAAEIDAHLAHEADEQIERGMSPEDARYAALRRFGNVGSHMERYRERSPWFRLETLWQDLRYGGRVFARTPGFTATAVLTLALGVGGVTVIYSVIRNVLLNPFPYADSRRMVDVLIMDTKSGRMRGAMDIPQFLAYREQNDVFDDVIGTVSAAPVTMAAREGVELLAVSQVTSNTFRFLDVPALIGRGILPSDGEQSAPPIAVLSHEAWVAHFGSDPRAVGRAILLDGRSRTIVGVMPPRFTWHVADVWVPLDVDHVDPAADPPMVWLQARLKRGVSLQQAEAQLTVIAQRRARLHPKDYPEQFRVAVITVIDFVVGRFRGVLYTLFGAVALLLLIACCNVANMLLARATVRERELTVRAALGASRWRLMRQLLIESLLLALAGAAAGCVVAYAGVAAVAAFMPQQGVPYEVELRLDGPALLFSLVTAIITALVFGLVPAWYGARRDLIHGLKDAGKGSVASSLGGWVRNSLIVAEVALSLVLLLGAGVVMRSLIAMVHSDLGFDPSNIALAVVQFPKGGYETADQRTQYYRQAADRISSIPGILEVAQSSDSPTDGWNTVIARPGVAATRADEGLLTPCDEHYLALLGLRPTSGRLLTDDDVAQAQHVAVVNQSLVAQHFGPEDPIGRTIRLERVATVYPLDVTFEIVGVVPDIRNRGAREDPAPAAYIPISLTEAARLLVMRTALDPQLLVQTIRQELRQVDRTVAVMGVPTLEESLRREYAQPRFSAMILATFAATGLLLVAVGVYGVMAYAASRRTHEIAIRMALGARPRQVIVAMLRSGAGVLIAGLAIGLIASIGTNRLAADIARTTPGFDAAATLTATLVVLIVGLVACFRPAARAARVDPMTTLRHD